MALTHRISNAEVSSNPVTGKITGDANPAVTQAGVITKLAKGDEQIETDILAQKVIFDPHDHDPVNPTGAGGQQIGAGGVRSIATGAITSDLINNGSITGLETALNAITTVKIADASIVKAQIGTARTLIVEIPAGGSYTWPHGKGQYMPFHIMSNSYAGEDLKTAEVTNSSAKIINGSSISLTVTIVYMGLS